MNSRQLPHKFQIVLYESWHMVAKNWKPGRNQSEHELVIKEVTDD